ncbi:MAG: hypothetical protein J1F05_06010 [Muribaculaceae bacterium]|nr:hypothetical protein [Muribaculaceae bacterium]
MTLVKTPQFTVGASEYAKAEALQYLSKLWWVLALIVLALGVSGCYDSRYWYLALMTSFVVYPLLMSFVWIAIVGRLSMQWLSRPQIWLFYEDNFTIDFYPFDANSDAPYEPIKSININYAEIKNIKHSNKYWMFIPSTHILGIRFLLIPEQYIPESIINKEWT